MSYQAQHYGIVFEAVAQIAQNTANEDLPYALAGFLATARDIQARGESLSQLATRLDIDSAETSGKQLVHGLHAFTKTNPKRPVWLPEKYTDTVASFLQVDTAGLFLLLALARAIHGAKSNSASSRHHIEQVDNLISATARTLGVPTGERIAGALIHPRFPWTSTESAMHAHPQPPESRVMQYVCNTLEAFERSLYDPESSSGSRDERQKCDHWARYLHDLRRGGEVYANLRTDGFRGPPLPGLPHLCIIAPDAQWAVSSRVLRPFLVGSVFRRNNSRRDTSPGFQSDSLYRTLTRHHDGLAALPVAFYVDALAGANSADIADAATRFAFGESETTNSALLEHVLNTAKSNKTGWRPCPLVLIARFRAAANNPAAHFYLKEIVSKLEHEQCLIFADDSCVESIRRIELPEEVRILGLGRDRRVSKTQARHGQPSTSEAFESANASKRPFSIVVEDSSFGRTLCDTAAKAMSPGPRAIDDPAPLQMNVRFNLLDYHQLWQSPRDSASLWSQLNFHAIVLPHLSLRQWFYPNGPSLKDDQRLRSLFEQVPDLGVWSSLLQSWTPLQLPTPILVYDADILSEDALHDWDTFQSQLKEHNCHFITFGSDPADSVPDPADTALYYQFIAWMLGHGLPLFDQRSNNASYAQDLPQVVSAIQDFLMHRNAQFACEPRSFDWLSGNQFLAERLGNLDGSSTTTGLRPAAAYVFSDMLAELVSGVRARAAKDDDLAWLRFAPIGAANHRSAFWEGSASTMELTRGSSRYVHPAALTAHCIAPTVVDSAGHAPELVQFLEWYFAPATQSYLAKRSLQAPALSQLREEFIFTKSMTSAVYATGSEATDFALRAACIAHDSLIPVELCSREWKDAIHDSNSNGESNDDAARKVGLGGRQFAVLVAFKRLMARCGPAKKTDKHIIQFLNEIAE